MNETIEIDTKGLDKILKALKGKLPVGRVGILGEDNLRSGKDKNGAPGNAFIGAQHEYGNSELPPRSFLRMPITENLRQYLDESGAFTKDVLNQVIKEGSIKEWVQKITTIAETIVIDAFDSGGFGKWKPSNMANKKNHQTLVETQQLRNSISSDVK